MHFRISQKHLGFKCLTNRFQNKKRVFANHFETTSSSIQKWLRKEKYYFREERLMMSPCWATCFDNC